MFKFLKSDFETMREGIDAVVVYLEKGVLTMPSESAERDAWVEHFMQQSVSWCVSLCVSRRRWLELKKVCHQREIKGVNPFRPNSMYINNFA